MHGLEYAISESKFGLVGVLGSADGLIRITLPHPSEQEVFRHLGNEVRQAKLAPQRFRDLMERLKSYFSGEKVYFTDRLDLSGATIFRREVWNVTRLIPYGETRSYIWLAAKINRPKSQRAVGQALGDNPFPIIVPCHRVLRSDKRLGGYAGGLEMKKHLLRLEGCGWLDCD